MSLSLSHFIYLLTLIKAKGRYLTHDTANRLDINPYVNVTYCLTDSYMKAEGLLACRISRADLITLGHKGVCVWLAQAVHKKR